MRILTQIVAVATVLAAGIAVAKLPPPTPEEVAAATAKKAQEEVQLEKQKELLTQAQDRVAATYRKAAGASAGAGQRTQSADMPKTTRELPGQAGPQGGREPSAEAHSAPAK